MHVYSSSYSENWSRRKFWTYYSLNLECSSKASWKVPQSWGTVLIGRFIYSWVQQLTVLLWMGPSLKGWLPWWCDLKVYVFLPSSSFCSLIPGCHGLSTFSCTILFGHPISLLESVNNGLKLWVKISFSSFKLWILGSVSAWERNYNRAQDKDSRQYNEILKKKLQI